MTARTPLAAIFAGAIATGLSARAASLVDRAAAFVDRFEREFAVVIADERYEQRLTEGRAGHPVETTRTLESEVMFVRIERDHTWLLVRRVKTIDSKPAPDQSAALDTLLADGVNGTLPRLRELADENARDNLGHIERNFNDPTWVLRVFDAGIRHRFRFEEKGPGTIEYRERETPTLIRGRGREPARSRGTVTLNAAGAITETTLSVRFDGITADLTTRFGVDAHVGITVPLTMSERYTRRDETVTCTATYSNFRRFETSGRMIPPKPNR